MSEPPKSSILHTKSSGKQQTEQKSEKIAILNCCLTSTDKTRIILFNSIREICDKLFKFDSTYRKIQNNGQQEVSTWQILKVKHYNSSLSSCCPNMKSFCSIVFRKVWWKYLLKLRSEYKIEQITCRTRWGIIIIGPMRPLDHL